MEVPSSRERSQSNILPEDNQQKLGIESKQKSAKARKLPNTRLKQFQLSNYLYKRLNKKEYKAEKERKEDEEIKEDKEDKEKKEKKEENEENEQ